MKAEEKEKRREIARSGDGGRGRGRAGRVRRGHISESSQQIELHQ